MIGFLDGFELNDERLNDGHVMLINVSLCNDFDVTFFNGDVVGIFLLEGIECTDRYRANRGADEVVAIFGRIGVAANTNVV